MCVHRTSTAPAAIASLAAKAASGISFGVRYGEIRPAPAKPKVKPPTSTRPPSMTWWPGLQVLVHTRGTSTLP